MFNNVMFGFLGYFPVNPQLFYMLSDLGLNVIVRMSPRFVLNSMVLRSHIVCYLWLVIFA